MAILDPLPKPLAQALVEMPAPGNRNIWIFTVARRARHCASPEKIRRFLHTIAAHWTDRDFRPEIERAISRAFETKDEGPGTTDAGVLPRWPAFDPAAWEQRRFGPTIFGPKPLAITAAEILDRLYCHPPDASSTNSRPSSINYRLSSIESPLLCLSLDTRSAQTQPREKWRGLEAGMQFIVANEMTAETGLSQEGKISPRCHGNATRDRRYQVIEFDRGSLRDQAAILSSLHTRWTPLILVVWSGGKSLHGWFNVETLSPYWKLRFFRHAVHLGADSSLWDPAKLVRMPGGRRDNGATQSILHFNPPLSPESFRSGE